MYSGFIQLGGIMKFNVITTPQAKREFELGYLTTWHIEKAPMAPTWQVWLGSGMSAGWLVSQRDKANPRQFKTLESAVSAIEEVGFKVGYLRGA
jgi:hypothetical protein